MSTLTEALAIVLVTLAVGFLAVPWVGFVLDKYWDWCDRIINNRR